MTTRSLTPARSAQGSALTAGLRRAVAGLTGLWSFRQRSRTALGLLDDRLLKDIGLDPASAADEATKPFWRD